MEANRDSRPPRGALAVIAIGLVATVAAALLSTQEPLGTAVLDWQTMAPLPDSKPAPIPGGGTLRLSEAGIRATEANGSEERLYRVAAVLSADAGAAVEGGKLRCATWGAVIARGPDATRASYPRSTEGKDLLKQGEVPTMPKVAFSVEGAEAARVELADAFNRYTTAPGIVVTWGAFHDGVERVYWDLPDRMPRQPLKLGFASIWRTTSTPRARIECTLTAAAGSATARTGGRLG